MKQATRSRRSRRFGCRVLVLALSFPIVAGAQEAEFEVLPDFFQITGLAHDGNTLSGNGSGSARALRWTEVGGVDLLGAPPIGGTGICEGTVATSSTTGISADGQVVIGTVGSLAERVTAWGTICSEPRAAVFSGGSITLLGPPTIIEGENGSRTSATTDVSADGSEVIGQVGEVFGSTVTNNLGPAFLMPGTAALLGFSNFGARALSNEGSVVAGQTDSSDSYLWSGATGLEVVDGRGILLSGDGNTIVYTRPFFGSVDSVFRRVGEAVEEDLGTCSNCAVEDISADGSILVGRFINAPNPSSGWIWIDGRGRESLHTFLTEAGVSLSGWRVGTNTLFVSGDGTTVVGTAKDPSGVTGLFRARILPPDGDADGDGLTNAEEAALATSPWNSDTDGDGLGDAHEVALGTDPLVPNVGECNDGIDNDGDGRVDFDQATFDDLSAGGGDLGCASPIAVEAPACQDGADNDMDGGFDWDGGASAGVPPGQHSPDPHCLTPYRGWESPRACGLGLGVAPVLTGFWFLRKARTRRSGTASEG